MKNSAARRVSGLLLIVALLFSGCSVVQLPGTPENMAVPVGVQASFAAMEPPAGVGAQLHLAPVLAPEPEPEPEPEIPTAPEAPEVLEAPTAPPYPPFPEQIRTVCGQAFAYDLDTGRMLGIKGVGEKLYPASVTKLLTILLALEYLEPDQLVTPGDEQVLVAEDSSMAYVNYHTLTVEQLIEGMLLPSGNDAACALAAATGRAIAGDENLSGVAAVQVCVDAMNTYAAEIGMENSHFVTVDGYLDPDHYSTVEDMAVLAVKAAQNEIIRKYCGRAMDEVTFADGYEITWYNSNQLLYMANRSYNRYVTGMKTGSLLSHYSLVCTVEKDGKTYVTGVFSAPSTEDRYYDMTTVIHWLTGETRS